MISARVGTGVAATGAAGTIKSKRSNSSATQVLEPALGTALSDVRQAVVPRGQFATGPFLQLRSSWWRAIKPSHVSRLGRRSVVVAGASEGHAAEARRRRGLGVSVDSAART